MTSQAKAQYTRFSSADQTAPRVQHATHEGWLGFAKFRLIYPKRLVYKNPSCAMLHPIWRASSPYAFAVRAAPVTRV